MEQYSHLTADQKDAESTMARLSVTENELNRLIKEVTTEETTYSQNVDINTYPGYSYYDSEVKRLRSLIINKQQGVESVTKAYRAKRESQIETLRLNIAKMEKQIETLQNEITNYVESSGTMTNTIECNHSQQIEVYLSKMQKIRDVIGIPTSLPYRRKKTRIEELQKLAEEQRQAHMIASNYSIAKNKHEYMMRARIERQKEEEKERIEKDKALAAWERQQEAQREADRQKWASKGLETETAENFEPEPVFDLSTSEGRNAEKAYRRKLLKK
jgi:hypothetical protein